MTAPPLTSRFQLLDRPVAHPGKCCVCGATDRECVDFGMDLEDYGAVYFCTSCLREVGLIVGLIHPDVYEQAKLEAGQSVEEYLSAHEKVAVTHEFYELCHNLVSGFSTAVSPDDVRVGRSDPEPVDETHGTDGQELLPNSTSGQADSVPDDKPASKRRSSGVSANSSNAGNFNPLT